MHNHVWPVELRLSGDKGELTVAFDDGASFTLPAELLRVMSPSAEVQGHSAAERKTVPGKRNVKIVKLEPTGNYAIRIIFDDRHETGIFTWAYLHELGAEMDGKWAAYLSELGEKGLSRG